MPWIKDYQFVYQLNVSPPSRKRLLVNSQFVQVKSRSTERLFKGPNIAVSGKGGDSETTFELMGLKNGSW